VGPVVGELTLEQVFLQVRQFCPVIFIPTISFTEHRCYIFSTLAVIKLKKKKNSHFSKNSWDCLEVQNEGTGVVMKVLFGLGIKDTFSLIESFYIQLILTNNQLIKTIKQTHCLNTLFFVINVAATCVGLIWIKPSQGCG